MYLNNKKILSCLCLFVLIAGFCQADIVSDLFKQHKQTQTVFSILVADADSGTVRYRRNADKPMIPASNMKIVTSAAALHYLGGSYKFETKIGLLGKDLIIVGGGDPLLADPKNDSYPCEAADTVMNQIISILQKIERSEINNIIVDNSFFDNNRVHPSWPADQLNQWYACEIDGLNFYNNCVHLQATRSGNTAILSMTPPNNYVHLVNQLKLISKGSSAVGAYRNSVPNKLLVRGNLNQEAGFDVAIENPAGLFASILNDKLKAAGIAVRGQLLQKYIKNDEKIRYLIIFQTPIANVLKRCNTNSLGLAAECLVKTISAENTEGRTNGQWQHGQSFISRYLDSLKVSRGHYVLDDGSGLSRNNRLTAACLVTVLRDMYKIQDTNVFMNSLAIGGQDGTIEKYFRQSPYQGRILGKTGYISGVRSFSGICKTPQGDIIFSILTEKGNGYTRSCINEIAKAIYDRKL